MTEHYASIKIETFSTGKQEHYARFTIDGVQYTTQTALRNGSYALNSAKNLIEQVLREKRNSQ